MSLDLEGFRQFLLRHRLTQPEIDAISRVICPDVPSPTVEQMEQMRQALLICWDDLTRKPATNE